MEQLKYTIDIGNLIHDVHIHNYNYVAISVFINYNINMIIKLDDYTVNRKPVREFIEANKELDFNELLKRLVIITSCPVIVVSYFIGEVIGFTPEIKERIETLTKFYDYEKIE